MSKTILIVEDDPSTMELERDILLEQGYRVVTDLGEEALATARREHPDLILLDLMMPGMDGWTVREGLLRHPATADIPVIVLTARTRDTWDAGNMQARTVIQKPFDLGGFLREVRKVVGE